MVVLPSLDEGFGLPALEAMTIGVPVVVSSRGALPEVVGGAGLIVDPDDVAGTGRRDGPAAERPGACSFVLGGGHRTGAAIQLGRQRRAPDAAPTRRRSRGADHARDASARSSASTPASSSASRPASDAISPSCSSGGRREPTPHRRRFVLYTPERLPLSFPSGTVDVRIAGAGVGARNVVGADPSPEGRQPRFARRLLRARLHRPAWHVCPSRGHDSRHLVCGAPGVVPRAGRSSADDGSPAAPRTAAAVVFTDSQFSRSELETRLRVDSSRIVVIPPGVTDRGTRDAPAGGARTRRPLRRIALQPAAAARPHRGFCPSHSGSPPGPAHHRRRRPHVAAAGPGRRRGRARCAVENRVSTLRGRTRARGALSDGRRCSRFCRSTRASA